MTKKLAKAVAAAKARTKATPLAENGIRRARRAGDPPIPAVVESVAAPLPLSRIAYVAVRQVAGALPGETRGQYLDMFTLSNTFEGAQNGINERQRIDAVGLRKGTIDPYLRVAKIEIREIGEDAR